MFSVLLPAAATNSMSAVRADSIAAVSAEENPGPPQLLFSTRTLAAPVPAKCALAWMANSMALIALATVPPLGSENLRAIMLATQLTPVTPMPLLPTAPMVPATCVP